MLAQTPTTQRAWSEDNLTASLEQRNLDNQEHNTSSEQLIEGSRLYDEAEIAQEGTRNPSQYNRTVSVPSQQRSSTAFQRGASARASTRSMPGSIVNSNFEAVQRKRVKTQTSEIPRPVQNRERVRSMYDPLPDIPTENNQHVQQTHESSPVAAEPEIIINVLTPNTPEHAILRNDQLTPPPLPPESRVSCSPTEKQFSFEDGSVLHSDVPPFLDPDITLESRSDDAQGISIYSSQILATSEEEDGMLVSQTMKCLWIALFTLLHVSVQSHSCTNATSCFCYCEMVPIFFISQLVTQKRLQPAPQVRVILIQETQSCTIDWIALSILNHKKLSILISKNKRGASQKELLSTLR